jgi:hypothetical protein
MNLALVYHARNDMVTALRLSREALLMAGRIPGVRPLDLVRMLIAAGQMDIESDLQAEAAQTLQRAASMTQEYLGENHPEFAEILLLQARLLRKSDRKALARRLEARATEIKTNHGRENLMGHSVDVSALRSRK